MTLEIVLDVAFAVLLVITIGYAILLNRKLGNLRQHKEELERLAATFSQSMASAEGSIKSMKSTLEELQTGINKAQGLRDDLAFLIDRGSLAADRLEDSVRGARSQSKGDMPSGPKRPFEPVETISQSIAARRGVASSGADNVGRTDANMDADDFAKQKSQAEKDLIEALRQVR